MGIDIDAINEDNEENFERAKIINQVVTNINPKKKFIANKIPTYVATPLPPLNFNQIGKT